MKIFILLAILMHVAFAVLFARVTPSVTPPPEKKLSLSILTRGSVRGDIIQTEASWPMPRREEPAFAADEVLKSFDADIEALAAVGMPGQSVLAPKDTLVPQTDIATLAAEAHVGPAEDPFSLLSPDLKATPLREFALGPTVPELPGGF
jgi:hypothetical protein